MQENYLWLYQVKSSEGRQLAEEEHSKQIERALMRNSTTYLQSVPAEQLYFETSAKSGEGVAELFEFIQTTLVAELERKSSSNASSRSGSRRKGGKSGADQTIKVGEGGGETEGKKGCCN